MIDVEVQPGEEWRAVPGWEDRYWVSTHGRVASLPNRKRKSTKLLSVCTNNGYPYVMFWRDNKQTAHPIHVLLLEAFVGPRPAPGMYALHNDDDRSNYALSNLRWGTPSENSYDRVRNGNHPNANKTHCLRGHPLIGDNLRIKATGRMCLTCSKAAQRRWYLAKKAAA